MHNRSNTINAIREPAPSRIPLGNQLSFEMNQAQIILSFDIVQIQCSMLDWYKTHI